MPAEEPERSLGSLARRRGGGGGRGWFTYPLLSRLSHVPWVVPMMRAFTSSADCCTRRGWCPWRARSPALLSFGGTSLPRRHKPPAPTREGLVFYQEQRWGVCRRFAGRGVGAQSRESGRRRGGGGEGRVHLSALRLVIAHSLGGAHGVCFHPRSPRLGGSAFLAARSPAPRRRCGVLPRAEGRGGLPAFCRQRSRSLASTDLVHDASAPPLHCLVVPGRQLTVGALN